jgi:RNA polymerase sigma-70 factor (ECF subfamily)
VNSGPDKRLSEIETSWTELELARKSGQQVSRASEARRALLNRYAAPVYRYLLACVRDENVADDLLRNFALRFLRGRYESADRDRGRFRDFLKRSLSNLATDHFRRRNRHKETQISVVTDATTIALPTPAENFDDLWRQEVLNLAWDALKNLKHGEHSPLFVVLNHRAEFPGQSSAEMADASSVLLKRDQVTEVWVRQTLHRARQRFSELLRSEVRRTLGSVDSELVDDELAELGLLKYCK